LLGFEGFTLQYAVVAVSLNAEREKLTRRSWIRSRKSAARLRHSE
jgi:hypothetical protein